MLERLNGWAIRRSFPRTGGELGCAAAYWDPDPTHYAGWKQLRNRLAVLGDTPTSPDLAYRLASNLLGDVLAAAGGVEWAIAHVRATHKRLTDVVSRHHLPPASLLADDAGTEALYAFSDVLSWSRTVEERLQRKALDRNMRDQGLIPAIKHQQLRNRCDCLWRQLHDGPVGQARYLANFLLHSAMVRRPFSVIAIDTTGGVILPIPDTPSGPVEHWDLLTWTQKRDGFTLAEELWQAIQTCIDELLDAFEQAMPKQS